MVLPGCSSATKEVRSLARFFFHTRNGAKLHHELTRTDRIYYGGLTIPGRSLSSSSSLDNLISSYRHKVVEYDDDFEHDRVVWPGEDDGGPVAYANPFDYFKNRKDADGSRRKCDEGIPPLEEGSIIPVQIKRLIPEKGAVVKPVDHPHARAFCPWIELRRERYVDIDSMPEDDEENELRTSQLFQPGDTYPALVWKLGTNAKGIPTAQVSLRRAPPILPESFQPCTLAVFGLPKQMVRYVLYCFSVGFSLRNFPVFCRASHWQSLLLLLLS